MQKYFVLNNNIYRMDLRWKVIKSFRGILVAEWQTHERRRAHGRYESALQNEKVFRLHYGCAGDVAAVYQRWFAQLRHKRKSCMNNRLQFYKFLKYVLAVAQKTKLLASLAAKKEI